MKKYLFAISLLLLIFATPCFAVTTYYATSSTININAANTVINAACVGSGNPYACCTGVGTGTCTYWAIGGTPTACGDTTPTNYLSWNDQIVGDTFNANGCTAIALNVDPAGTGGGIVTLTNDATNGGGYTYATAANLTLNINTLATAAAYRLLLVSGSTGGGTVTGNSTGGSGNTAYGIQDIHTVVNFTISGNCTGGTVTALTHGYYATGTGPTTISGNCIGGTFGYGCIAISTGGSGITVVGKCIGNDTASSAAGCRATGTTPVIATGPIINCLGSQGASANVIYTPASTASYILYPKNSSYVCDTLDSNATQIPSDPGVANVKNGVTYGTLTGTYSGGGGGAWAY